jgi:hypothetical protein
MKGGCRAVSQHHLKRKPELLPGYWSSASLVARDEGVSFAKVWRLAERECIEVTAGKEARGYWRLSPERRAAVIEARRDNPDGTQHEIARAAGSAGNRQPDRAQRPSRRCRTEKPISPISKTV